MMQDGCCEMTEQNHCDEAYLASSCGSCPSLAMAYSPFQHFHGLYETDEALHRGTLFVELDKPWKAGMSR
ncbi:MAG: spore coat associated protein CotJA [Clostridia bacterium]|nr:spore coat associated protein CotJA [Clostridia bacterium]